MKYEFWAEGKKDERGLRPHSSFGFGVRESIYPMKSEKQIK